MPNGYNDSLPRKDCSGRMTVTTAATAAATERAKAYVESLVNATTDLLDWSMTPSGISVKATYDEPTAAISVIVTPPSGTDSLFLKVGK